jgi:CheY-like chemotaxis protein
MRGELERHAAATVVSDDGDRRIFGAGALRPLFRELGDRPVDDARGRPAMSSVQHLTSHPGSLAGNDGSRRPEPSKQTRDLPVVRRSAGKPLVLVLDDDWETCDAFKEVLEEGGFEVVCLPDGMLGLEHLAQHPVPAAIVLDLMMPVMDGWTFVSRLRALPHLKEVPILISTGAGPHWGYPSSPVLRKPVGRNELLATLRTLIHAQTRHGSGF